MLRKRSTDGGRTWRALVQLPQVADAECSSESWPFITYAAGGRLYAAYLYMKTNSCLTGVALSVSTDQGATWSAPTKVFEEVSACDGFLGRGSFFASGEGYNDVRVAAAPDEPWVYVAAQIFHYHDLHIVLGSSRDQGARWTGTDIAHIFSDEPQFFRGFALAAARKGNVLVAFRYEDGATNYRVYVRRSSDHGASVDRQLVIADQSESSLLSDPDIEIGPSGTAHLAYARGGEAIVYKYSYAPYATWSAEAVRLDNNVPPANVGAPPRRGRLRTGERPARDLGGVSEGRGRDPLCTQGGATWLRLVRAPEGRHIEEWHFHEWPRRRRS